MNATRQLTLPADVNNLVAIADFIAEVTEAANFGPRAAYAVQMAVDEACTNIIEHAYGPTRQGDIRLLCRAEAEGLRIDIFDRGGPFNPNHVPDFDPGAPLEDRGARGMGMFFMHKLMDHVQYQFDTPEGNQLTLFKAHSYE